MQRRHLLILGTLLAFIGGGGLFAARLWRRQLERTVAAAGVAPVPDLRRWPAPFSEAISRESLAVATAPAPLAALGRLATLYSANGFEVQAERALRALVQLDPAQPRWPYLLADALLRRGDKPGAVASLRKALALEPAYVPGLRRLAELLDDQGDLAGARACLERALAADPESAASQYDLVCLEARHGGGGAVRARMEALVRQNPSVKPFHEQLADMLESAQDARAAAQERELAAESELYVSTADPWIDDLDMECFDASRMIVRAIEMRREGRFSDVEKIMQRVIDLAPLEPANPIAWDLLSNLYLKTGRPLDARRTLEKAVKEFPDEPQMPLLLERLLCDEQLPEDAVAVGRAAAARWPQRGDLQAALGVALRDKGDFRGAESALREALRLDGTLTEAQYALATVLLELDQRGPAHAALERALGMRPDYPEALFAISRIDLEAGDYAAAESRVLRLFALKPREPSVRQLVAAWRMVRGQAALQSGDPDEADRQFRAGLLVAPDFAALLREAGSLAAQRQRWADAVDLLSGYVKAEPDDARGCLSLALALRNLGRGPEAAAVIDQGLAAATKVGDSDLIERLRALKRP